MLKETIRYWLRDQIINRRNRARLKGETEVSIIANDCLGGVICHDLNLKLLSPTVNYYMSPDNYIRFLSNLDFYLHNRLSDPVREEDGSFTAKIADLVVHLGHCSSYEEAYAHWEERKKRVRKESMCVIMDDRNGCTEEHMKQFLDLPYEHKVFLSHLPNPDPRVCYIKGFEEEPCVGVLTRYRHYSIKRIYDAFDWVSFLNGVTCETPPSVQKSR